MSRQLLLLVILAMLTSAGGCASGPNLPDYVAPTLAADQASSIDGYAGTYITVVDNTKIPGQWLFMENMGGNKVVLAPGPHHLTIERHTGSGGGGMMLHNTARWAVDHDFKIGHDYEIGPENRWNPFNSTMVIKDKKDGTIKSL